MDIEANNLKVRENRLRRAAARQGMFLSRRRRRDHNALDFGLYALFRDGRPAYGVGYGGVYGLTLNQVELILAAGSESEPTAKTTPPKPNPPSDPPAPLPAPRRRGLGARSSRRGR